METDSPGLRVAANVRALRDIRGLSVRDLSARLTELGRPLLPSGITKIEQGSRRVDVDDLLALAVALGVNPSRLFLPDRANDDEVPLTPERSVPAWAAWQWADAFAPLPTQPEGQGLNTDDELEDFQLHSRPAEIRREQRHPLMLAVNNLRGSAQRVVRHAVEHPQLDLLTSSLTFARRNLQRVAGELDAIEEEAASRGER